MGISFVISLAGMLFSLYLFPNQDNFWTYTSLTYFLSVLSLSITLYITAHYLRKLMSHLVEMPFGKTKILLWTVLYSVIPIVLILFLPIHTLIIFLLFGFYQWRVWNEKRKLTMENSCTEEG